MRIVALAMALHVLPFTFGSAAGAETGRPAPFEMVRSLEALQNQAAEGNAAAYASRPKLIAQIAERFLAADPQLWREPRNARAVATYVLSGGQPAVLRKLIGLDVLPKDDEKLMKGALAFAEGREVEARQLLIDIDAQSLPPSLGGQVALIQATLLMNQDRRRAVALLDVARLLMPGTLVEDVALRREILISGDGGDVDQFLSLSEQYARRFRQSVYADNFWQGFATSAAKLTPPGDPRALQRLDALVSLLEVNEQRNVFLSIAQISAIGGNIGMARFASERAAALSQEGSIEKARAKLYQAAALIVTDDYDKGVEALEAVAKSPLTSRDAQLRQAVLALAQALRLWPQASDPPDAGQSTSAAAGAAVPPSPTAALINLAEKRALDADQLLKRSLP